MPQPPESEAVRLWRDFAKLNLTVSWKHDVDITVTDLELWKSILLGWFWIDAKGKKHKKSPAIKPLLDEYERQQFDAIQQNGSGVHCSQGVPERTSRRVPEFSMPALLTRTRM